METRDVHVEQIVCTLSKWKSERRVKAPFNSIVECVGRCANWMYSREWKIDTVNIHSEVNEIGCCAIVTVCEKVCVSALRSIYIHRHIHREKESTLTHTRTLTHVKQIFEGHFLPILLSHPWIQICFSLLLKWLTKERGERQRREAEARERRVNWKTNKTRREDSGETRATHSPVRGVREGERVSVWECVWKRLHLLLDSGWLASQLSCVSV